MAKKKLEITFDEALTLLYALDMARAFNIKNGISSTSTDRINELIKKIEEYQS